MKRANLHSRDAVGALPFDRALIRSWGAAIALLVCLALPAPAETWTQDMARLEAATRAFGDGFTDRAIDILERFTTERSDSEIAEDAHLLLARAYLDAHQSQRAYETLNRWRQQNEWERPGALFWMAEARRQQADTASLREANANASALRTQRLEQASALYRRLLTSAPNSDWEAPAALALIHCHSLLGRYQDALEVLRAHARAVERGLNKKDPPYPIALVATELLIQLGAWDDATEALDQVFAQRLSPEHYWEATFLKHQLALQQGNAREVLRRAEPLRRAAIMTGSQEAVNRARLLIASAAIAQDRLPRAAEQLEKIAENAPDLEVRQFALRRLIQLYVREQRYNVAESILRQFENAHPDPTGRAYARLTRAELAVAVDGAAAWEDQLAVFREIAGGAADDSLAHYARLRYAEGLAALGQDAAALTQFQRLAEIETASEIRISAQIQAAERFFRLERNEEALKAFQTVWTWSATLQFPEPTLARFCASRIVHLQLRFGERADAFQFVQSLEASDELKPLVSPLTLDIALWDRDHGALSSARTLLAARAFPESDDREGDLRACLTLAETYEDAGDWDGAIAIYERWAANAATNADLEAGLAMARFMRNRGGLRDLAQFIAQYPRDPRTPQFAFMVASQLHEMGRHVEAAQNFESIALSPIYPRSHLTLWARLYAGIAWRAHDDFERAMAHFTALSAIREKDWPEGQWSSEPVVDAFFAIHDLWAQRAVPPQNRTRAFEAQTQTMTRFLESFPDHPNRAQALGLLGCAYLKRWDTLKDNPQWLTRATDYFESARELTDIQHDPTHTFAKASVGLGLALEAQAGLATGAEQTRLLESALQAYKDYFYFEGALTSPHWYRAAGEAAARLIEERQVDDIEKAQKIRQALADFFSEDPSLTLRDSPTR